MTWNNLKDEIRIIIADDYPIIRNGLRHVIAPYPNLNIVADMGSGSMAIERIRTLQPHVAILDIELTDLDGLTVANLLRSEKLDTAVLFLTSHHESDCLNRALEAGALGYVLKNSDPSDIIDAIRAVALGDYYISSALSNNLVNKRRNLIQSQQEKKTLTVLSPTERRVLELLSSYKTSREIANELNISPRTVQTHRTNICKKMELHGNYALMKFALSYLEEV